MYKRAKIIMTSSVNQIMPYGPCYSTIIKYVTATTSIISIQIRVMYFIGFDLKAETNNPSLKHT